MAQQNGGVDRLSVLPNHVLGHILSFLPTPEEAGRAAVLSRRWRYIFAHVHTMSFDDDDHIDRYPDEFTFYFESTERRSLNGSFLDRVNAALLCRRRCSILARRSSPLRAFRVAIHYYDCWDEEMVSMWISHALRQSDKELHLDLRLHAYRLCERGDGRSHDRYSCDNEREWEGWLFAFPRSLFSSAVLRSLRLSHCWLNLPDAVVLPSLETLHLTTVEDSEETIHQLISGCIRLADLTLESCSDVKRVSILGRRLRRFALRCCHAVVRVSLDASQLRFLDYRGAVPTASLFAFRGSPKIHSCTIDFCGPSLSSEKELAGFRKLLENFAAAKHLHLNSSQLGCGIGSKFLMVAFPTFHSLQKLELTGYLESHSITRVLRQTPNLEVLSLFLVPDPEYNPVTIPDAPPPVLCLQHRLKEINLVQYQGSEEQRTLAQLLLGSALVLQTLCVVFPDELLELPTLMNEIARWVVSKSPKITFL